MDPQQATAEFVLYKLGVLPTTVNPSNSKPPWSAMAGPRQLRDVKKVRACPASTACPQNASQCPIPPGSSATAALQPPLLGQILQRPYEESSSQSSRLKAECRHSSEAPPALADWHPTSAAAHSTSRQQPCFQNKLRSGYGNPNSQQRPPPARSHALHMSPTAPPATLRGQRRALQDAQKASKVRAHMGAAAAELVLVRHGETDWNSEHRLQGQLSPGPPLNALGQQQALALAQALVGQQFDALYSSDLLRTLQTAQVVAEQLHLQVHAQAQLRERHLGCLQGLTYAQCPLQQPAAWDALQSADSSMRLPGGGESLDDLQQRMVKALEDLATKHPGQRVLVVTHGGVLRTVHCHARGCSPPGRVSNGALATVVIEGHGKPWALLGWNDTRYMEVAGCAPAGDGFGGGRTDG